MQHYRSVPVTVLMLCIVGSQCDAQTTAPPGASQGPLVQVASLPQFGFDALEQLAAAANQASYNLLTSNPNAALYCNPNLTAPSAQCPQQVYLTFSNLRSLVQTANALLANDGPTRYSLNIDALGLANAMRWTAAEELSAPSSAATQFSNSLASIANRITALRLGASGFSVSGISMPTQTDSALAYNPPHALGGGASADSAGLGGTSRWGGFLNGNYDWGSHAATVEEDAFAFDSRDLTLGVDYRFSRRMVLGGAVGYSNQRIDFDSARSVVGGYIHSNGYNLQVFGLYEWDGPYVSVALGAGRTNYHSSRLITYPSQNILVYPVDATAVGSTHGVALNSGFELGWSFAHRAFGLEPYVSGNYQHIHLDGFHESSYDNGGPNAGQPAGFDFDYAAQRISAFDTAVGARLSYTLSSRYGVLVGYLRAEHHHLFDDNPGTVVTAYNAIAGGGAEFQIPTTKPDNNFQVYAAGASVVLPHGLQAFVQYQQSVNIAAVANRAVSGGIRGEF